MIEDEEVEFPIMESTRCESSTLAQGKYVARDDHVGSSVPQISEHDITFLSELLILHFPQVGPSTSASKH